MKQKRAAIPFDRLDGDKHRIPRPVELRLVAGVERWSEAAAKSKRAVKILRGDAVFERSAQTNTEPPGVTASYHGSIILQLEAILRVKSSAVRRAAAGE